MHRFAAVVIASCCALAVAPVSALARRHHSRPHHARHHHVRKTERFGTVGSVPSTPASGAQTAGTVGSFTNGVLTIDLSNGSTISGTVTSDTEIECASSTTMGDDVAGDGGPGPSSGSGDGRGDGSGDQGGDDGSGDQGDDGGDGMACGTAALTPAATVVGAELTITSAGATWSKVELG